MRRHFPAGKPMGVLLLLSLALAAGSCGGGGQSNLVGMWQGQTSQGAPVSFQVQKTNQPNVFTVFCFAFNVTDTQFRSLGTGCDAGAATFPINAEAIAIKFPVNQTTVFTVSGQFNSSSFASGTIKDMAGNSPISLDWTATKQ